MTAKALLAALLLATALPAQAALAQSQAAAPPVAGANRPLTAADLDGLRAELRSSRKQMVAQTLKLTDDEATRFWPVYDKYEADLKTINNTRYALIAEYANTYGKYDDKAATAFITRWLDVDVQTNTLRARYAPQFGKVLPGIKQATFLQIDRRIGMAIDLKTASMLPILQAQSQLAPKK